ncbi:MAG: hypothetical protein ACT4PM_01585 [Gemmatimonadales bacterium]
MPRPGERGDAAGASRGAGWGWPALVAIVALAACLAGIGNDLVQDDVAILVESERLHGVSRWREILTSPYWPPPHSPDLYRPLTAILLALEYAVGGGSPLGFRIASYLLYAAASVAVFQLGRRLVPVGVAGSAALLFAAHPIHVEAVALAVGQGELLVALLGTVMVIRYVERRRQRGVLAPGDWLVLGALYLAASLAKEHGLVLPALLVAAELTVLRGSLPIGRHFLPGYAFMGGLGVLVVVLRAAVLGEVTGTFTAATLAGLTLGGRVLTMLAVVPHWARLLLWPAGLQADYSPQEIPPSSGLGWAEVLGVGLLAAAAAGAWLARRRAPVIAFGVLWMGVALLPVSNLIPIGIVLAERTLFLASVGFAIAAGGLLLIPWTSAARLSATMRRGLGLIGAGVLLALIARSALRQRDWRDDRTFRIQGVQDAPRSWRTQLSYASLLFEEGRPQESLAAYRQALELAPALERWKVRNDLAQEYLAQGANALAVEQLRASLAEAPEQEATRHYLVLGLLALGGYREAAAEADSAVARGGSAEVFGELKALADSARRLGVPPGGIRLRVRAPR